MQWYPWFEADYLRHTLHLTWLEDCAYRRLLDLCYRNGGYVTADKEVLYRQIRATEPDQQKAVDTVLAEFFFSRGRVKVNRRASEELLKVKSFHEARVRGGKERAKRAAQAQLSLSPAVVSTFTSTSTQESPNSTFSQVQGLGIPLSLWTQYKKLRERLHRPILSGAEDHVIAELLQFKSAGEDPTEILTRAVRTSSWKLYPNGTPQQKGESKNEQTQRKITETFARVRKSRGLSD